MTGGYDFYLGRCLLPVPPGKLQVKINNTNETVVLMNQGEIKIYFLWAALTKLG